MKIPFGEWLPDLASTGNPGALVANNVIPAADGYRPFYRLSSQTNALTAYARGAIAVRGSDGNTYNYAGDATKLYSLSSATWSDVSRLVGGAYTLGTEDRWAFVKFGEYVIASSYTDAPQIIALGGANFAALSGSPPKAKTIAVVRDFVVLGGINDGTAKLTTVKWSGFGDETSWTTNPATQSDEQELGDIGGQVLRIIGGAYGTIFRQRGITRMDYEGPPTTFRFNHVERARGAISAGAICDGGGPIYYIGDDDFYVFDGQASHNIGSQKVARYFFNDLQGNYAYRITSSIDYARSLVIWSYPGAGSSSGTPNKLIMFHWPTARWSSAEVECNSLYALMSSSVTLEGLDAFGTMDTLSASLDSPVWQGGRLSLAAFDTTHKASTFTGSALTATLETTEIESEGRETLIGKARPLIDGTTATVTVQHGTKNSLREATSYATAVGENSNGEFELRGRARFHRLKTSISGGFDTATGMQVTESKVLGKR